MKVKSTPSQLEKSGAYIKIIVSNPQNDKCLKEGFALIDTGSNHSFIEGGLVENLKLNANDGLQAFQSDPQGSRPVDSYTVGFEFPDLEIKGSFLVTCNVPKPAFINGEQIIAVVGRDFLSKLKFEYDGVSGEYTIELPEANSKA